VHFTLADLIADIAQNACEAGASLVEIELRETDGETRFSVRDDGRGMTPGELARAVDPFVTDGAKHPGRRVGLGLPFLIQTAEQAGGGWDAVSEKGKGTHVSAWIDPGSVDAPPLGDVPDLFRSVLTLGGPAETAIRRTRDARGKPRLDYGARRSELEGALGSLEDAGALALLGRYLRSLEEEDEDEGGA
jgi:hypothetical protein